MTAGRTVSIEEQILQIIGALAIVESDGIGDDTDLFDAGMTSHASVKLMLALEDAFDIEFPDEMLQREYFSTVGTISQCVATITGAS